jgi:hypothetical protein
VRDEPKANRFSAMSAPAHSAELGGRAGVFLSRRGCAGHSPGVGAEDRSTLLGALAIGFTPHAGVV